MLFAEKPIGFSVFVPPQQKEGTEKAMAEMKTSLCANGLIWFGAALSIAEILTGTLLAPLGFAKGLLAILIGHCIGCALLYFAGLIGAQTHQSAMGTVKIAFGQKGSILFSILNILQLAGWTAVMIDSGASAAGAVVNIGGEWVWCFIIGALITLWILVGSKTLNRLNAVAMAALFVVTILLCAVILKGHSPVKPRGSLGFGAAVELSVAMPLSWLPLISDYTRTAARPKAATSVSVVVYFLTSSWMYSIGMSAAVFTGESDIAKIMKAAGLGAAALLIIVFSTVTTTFLDVYSAGVSSESISAKLKAKPFSVGVCVIGTLFAVLIPVTKFEDFLYLIGSVFAPMIAILIADYFVLKKDSSAKSADISNLIIWAAGFVMYRLFMKIETPMGSTLPVMLLTFMICALVYQITGGKKNAKAHT